jgi:hypothetical protein
MADWLARRNAKQDERNAVSESEVRFAGDLAGNNSKEPHDSSRDGLADLFMAFSSDVVVKIPASVRYRALTLSALAGELAIEPEILLPHLLSMRQKGILRSRRQSGRIFYSLENPELLEALDLMLEISMRQLQRADVASFRQPWRSNNCLFEFPYSFGPPIRRWYVRNIPG